ncbi:aminophospholipid translocase [Dispira simplex]|nr:aminophospholipid translocase [Dispira simplex]
MVQFYEREFERFAHLLFYKYIMVLESPAAMSTRQTSAHSRHKIRKVAQANHRTALYRVVECEFYVQDNCHQVLRAGNSLVSGLTKVSNGKGKSKSTTKARPKASSKVIPLGSTPVRVGFWDPFAHAHPLQKDPGIYYFHHVGQSTGYREGSRRGFDITLGCPGNTLSGGDSSSSLTGEVRAGVLIRTIQNLTSGEVVSGPCLVVNTVLNFFGVPTVKDMVNNGLHGDLGVEPGPITSSAGISRTRPWYFVNQDGPWDHVSSEVRRQLTSWFRTNQVAAETPRSTLLGTPRVGLGFNAAKGHLDAQVQYLFRPYRYLHPDIGYKVLTKGRPYTLLGILQAGLSQWAQTIWPVPVDHVEFLWWWILGFWTPPSDLPPDHPPNLADQATLPGVSVTPADCDPKVFLLPLDEQLTLFKKRTRALIPTPALFLKYCTVTYDMPMRVLDQAWEAIRTGTTQHVQTWFGKPLGNSTLIYQCFGTCLRYQYHKYVTQQSQPTLVGWVNEPLLQPRLQFVGSTSPNATVDPYDHHDRSQPPGAGRRFLRTDRNLIDMSPTEESFDPHTAFPDYPELSPTAAPFQPPGALQSTSRRHLRPASQDSGSFGDEFMSSQAMYQNTGNVRQTGRLDEGYDPPRAPYQHHQYAGSTGTFDSYAETCKPSGDGDVTLTGSSPKATSPLESHSVFPRSGPSQPPGDLGRNLSRRVFKSSTNTRDKSSNFRIIHLNNPPLNAPSKFIHNRISTAKYSLITFLPKFLLEQFSKYANIFFLFTSCIQQIDGVTPTSRYTTLGPLLVVLFATACKELVEDFKRHKSDAEVNKRFTKVLEQGQFVERSWNSVKVGDIIRVESSEPLPADVVLLSSSEPEGMCYIETSNLDGETNLKVKQALPQTATLLTPQEIAQLTGYIKSEKPNDSLYTYEGVLFSQGGVVGNQELSLDPTQVLLRGAVLRNTNWIYAVIIFTGHETKLMRNASAAPIKQTSVERMTNIQILFLFGILVSLAVACALGNAILETKNFDDFWYLHLIKGDIWKNFGLNILTFIILYNNLIPISLIVTMEVVKFQQSLLINSDMDIYHEETDTPALCRTSSLVEELGQIEYIFSDKTGTLTCNVMEFRQCSIGGIQYADVVDASNRARIVDGQPVGHYDFNQLREHLLNDTHGTKDVLHEFLALLATCHTVIPERSEEKPDQITYQASSPDEGALVEGAAVLDYKFHTRKPRFITVDILGSSYEYEVLNINEFNSTRKRMSALLRCPDGKIRMYCKGADTVIYERLSEQQPYSQVTLGHMEEYATEGLRTLCIAMREISTEEYDTWSQIYAQASTTLTNRTQELEKAAELIEKDMFLLGATAIEDKLQEGVPSTIFTLAQAGIKIWVLTGDRQETAINIGYSCKLIQEDFSLIICNEESHWATQEFLQKKLQAIKEGQGTNIDYDSLALIIDGKTLEFALQPDLEMIFLELATLCKSVVCCRVSPLQKALVVKLVKRRLKAILLAIGDGANDVSMIQAAHVGVGISGVEGLQAARSADFAISQFRFLRKLLLVHGAWSYHRLSKLILYSFYKNITLYMTQFWFSFFNSFSGQTIYESWSITFFNVLFVVMPPYAIGVFDQFLSARLLDRYPEMYKMGQKKEFFNVRAFWGSTINAIIHSLILYFGCMAAYWGDWLLHPGYTAGHWVFGVTCYTAVLATVLLKASLLTSTWTKYTYIAIPGSMVLWLVFLPIYATFAPQANLSLEYSGVIPRLFGAPGFWFTVTLLPTTALLRDYVWKYCKRMYLTRAYHIVQEIQKFNIPDYRPRMERFRKAVHKVRMIQRLRRTRGYAFSQTETGQAKLIRSYDTTRQKPRG